MRRKLYLVQVVRAVAIVFVLLGHLNFLYYEMHGFDFFEIGSWARTGGVDLFFVISGFMIYYIYGNKVGNFNNSKSFILKRFIRIAPFYWLVTLSAASLFFIVPQLGSEEDRSIWNVISSLLFINEQPILLVAWSLIHILFFYLLFGFLIAVPKTAKIIIAIFLIVQITSLFTQYNGALYSFNNIELWAGVLAAYIVKHGYVRNSTLILILGVVIFLCIWINNTYSFINLGNMRIVLYCLASMLIMIGSASVDLNHQIKIPYFIWLIGDASYSIFITHSPFLQFFILLTTKLSLSSIVGHGITMAIIAVFTVICGVISFKLVENPMNNYFNKKLFPKSSSINPSKIVS